MKEYFYHYCDNSNLIRVRSGKVPSEKTIPKRGAWPLYEWIKDMGFCAPCFGEITWGRLNRMTYLGRINFGDNFNKKVEY